MQSDPKPGDLVRIWSTNLKHKPIGLVTSIDATGWLNVTLDDGWQTYFRKNKLEVISKG
jgi:flagellar basal body rod protein FlgF